MKKNKKQANAEEKEKTPEPAPVVKKEKTPEPEIKEKTPENDPPPQPVPRKLKNKKKEEEEKAKKEEEQLTDEFVGFESEDVKFEGFETSKSQESFIPVESPTVEETATAMFEEFSKKSPPTKDDVSPNRDLVEFSEEESVVRVIEAEEDAEEDDKVEFFIKEKSSSVEPDNDMTSSGIDPMAARPNPWFEKFLKKGSSMIEDQIFGAVKKYEDMDEKGSEDEGMEELEKNQADTEKNIADLLEDDEDLLEPPPPPAPQIIESQPPSSNLSQLLKGESSKKAHVDDSSDDDFMFRPVPQQKKNKKQKKQKGQVLSLEEFHRTASQPRETDSGSVADSESEERTDLEDVFRFDSEMHEDEEDEEAAAQVGEQQRKKSVSVDDLNDALMEETTDESEAEGAAAVPIPNKEESVPESSSNAEPVKPILGTSMSSSYASSVDSESSTTNSPNPRSSGSQNKNKNKKGKKKKK